MKFQKVFWGLALVLCAVFIILDATDVIAPFTSVFGDVSVFFVILGIMLLQILNLRYFSQHMKLRI